MSHDAAASLKKLIYMANQIGKFFAVQKHDQAVAGLASHLARFWTPAMREKIILHLKEGGEGLDPLTKEAVQWLKVKQSNHHDYTGDA
ncbi:MAG: formate dehydrogenase subunit delta [Methylocapsa sp.]|nr:formate dehydrogenase subunit delta [Methylocapsa sp.]